MSGAARVTSIDALETTAVALERFRSDAAAALDEMELQARRAVGWIHHDRKDYWAHELRRSEEAVAEARVQLIQARTVRRVGDHEPACADEKRTLARAQRRHEIAQRKVEAVRRCTHEVDHAVDIYQRTRIQFLTWLNSDLALADAALKRMSASLESYISLRAPTDRAARTLVAGVSPTEGATASVPPQEVPRPDDLGDVAAAREDEAGLPESLPAADSPPADADPAAVRKGTG